MTKFAYFQFVCCVDRFIECWYWIESTGYLVSSHCYSERKHSTSVVLGNQNLNLNPGSPFCSVTCLSLFSHKLWFVIYRVKASVRWCMESAQPGLWRKHSETGDYSNSLPALHDKIPTPAPPASDSTLMKTSPPTSSSLIFCSSLGWPLLTLTLMNKRTQPWQACGKLTSRQ